MARQHMAIFAGGRKFSDHRYSPYSRCGNVGRRTVASIHNERTKLLASGLNNLAVATLASGILAPIIGFLYGSTIGDTHGWWFMIGVVWLLSGAGLHFLAWIALGRLKP
jgi:hypothetical protein